MDKKDKKTMDLLLEIFKPRAEKHFEEFVACAPPHIKSALDKSEKLRHKIFQIFYAGFYEGIAEFESLEELNNERRNKLT
jgi:hypothetical protein